MAKMFFTAAEVAELCGVSTSTGYKVCRELNAELSEKGFITFNGKVPVKYLQERLYGGGQSGEAAEKEGPGSMGG